MREEARKEERRGMREEARKERHERGGKKGEA